MEQMQQLLTATWKVREVGMGWNTIRLLLSEIDLRKVFIA